MVWKPLMWELLVCDFAQLHNNAINKSVRFTLKVFYSWCHWWLLHCCLGELSCYTFFNKCIKVLCVLVFIIMFFVFAASLCLRPKWFVKACVLVSIITFVILVCIVMFECYVFCHVRHSICILDDYFQMFLLFPSLMVAFECFFNFHLQQVLCRFGSMMHCIRVIHNCIFKKNRYCKRVFSPFFSLGFKVLCASCFVLCTNIIKLTCTL